MHLRSNALAILQIQSPFDKCRQTLALQPTTGLVNAQAHLAAPTALPCRPARPLLVAPSEVKRRTVHTLEGRAILIHR